LLPTEPLCLRWVAAHCCGCPRFSLLHRPLWLTANCSQLLTLSFDQTSGACYCCPTLLCLLYVLQVLKLCATPDMFLGLPLPKQLDAPDCPRQVFEFIEDPVPVPEHLFSA
jgi:hypothetical protein